MKTTTKQQPLKITVMNKKEFLLMDLRKVLNSDCTEVLNALQKIEWTPENSEGKKELLEYVGKLQKRWDDLYNLEYSNF